MRWIALIGILILILAAGGVAWKLTAASPSRSAAADAALSYAKQYMTWSQGPTVKSASTVRLSGLSGELKRYVAPDVRNNVNVADLIHRYGSSHQVVLVVLQGDFNSLPPDEGVTLSSDVVAVVDARTNRVLLLTD